MCTCDRNWQGSDCSLRTCPFGIAHVDIPKGDLNADQGVQASNVEVLQESTVYPHGTTEGFPYMVDTEGLTVYQNTAHGYAECSNKGLCDRSTGECECLAGYDGSSCQRASCPSYGLQTKGVSDPNQIFINQQGPNSNTGSVFSGKSVANIQAGECSGHGVCQSIKEIAASDFGNIYELWDKDISMGCVCDPGYGDADCSQRQCKYGVDPLWIDDTTIRVTETVVRIKSDLAGAGTLSGKYALRFFDVFGDDHVTEPLDLTPTGSGHCVDVVNALLGLPNHVVPSVECSDLTVINTNEGFEYTLKFIGNPGELRELEIVEHLDGNRPTIEVGSGATYAANVYTKVKGEFVDYFAEKCEGVTLKVVVDSDDSTNVFNVDVKPGSVGYLEIPTVAEENLLKVCLGHADDDPNNNHDIQNWDKGVVTESDGSPPVEVKMIGAFPHAIKVVPKEDTLGYDQFSKGSYHLVWYDEDASTGKKFRVANVNNNHNQPSEAVDSYVYTTKGNVQQLGYGTEVTEMLADNTDALSTSDRIVAYFDAYTNKLHTNFDTSCENQPNSPNARNHKCLEKGDKLFIIDSCWGKGNAAVAPMETNPFFGGKETTSCTDSTSLNHNTGNLYTVKKIYTVPKQSDASITDPMDTADTTAPALESQTIVDRFIIEVDVNVGWTGQKGDPENADTVGDGSTWSDNTGIVTLFHFEPKIEGTYEYVSQCSNRGLCNTDTGTCDCFSGYTGDDCSSQNALAV